RLLWSRRVDADADATPLRAGLQRGRGCLVTRSLAAVSDELADRGHGGANSPGRLGTRRILRSAPLSSELTSQHADRTIGLARADEAGVQSQEGARAPSPRLRESDGAHPPRGPPAPTRALSRFGIAALAL